jgi:hypothetical protein
LWLFIIPFFTGSGVAPLDRQDLNGGIALLFGRVWREDKDSIYRRGRRGAGISSDEGRAEASSIGRVPS